MDIIKYLSGMLNYNPEMKYMDEQKFTADGIAIPISEQLLATEAAPKMMTPPMTDEQVHKAAAAGEAWKKELQRWASASAELARNMKKLEIEDEQKMKELAVERDVVSQGMLQVQRDTGGRNKAVNIESIKTSEKPGYMLAEGGGYWSVNTDDPYWDTEEGYQEAIDLYGESPAWSSRPMEQENQFVDLQPTKRISL
tara:strand:- start:781 stop:1371 length:591 start_codon:yes stop_codon:yes gene_type:complete